MNALLSLYIGLFRGVPQAHAGITEACAIAGCTAIPSTTVSDLFVYIANMLIYSASGLCVLFIIYGGTLITFSLGDDSRFQKGKNSVLYAMLGFGLAVGSQSALAFVASVASFSASYTIAGNPIVTAIANVSNLLLLTFNTIFVIAIIVAGFQMVMARGASDKFEEARRTIMFAVAGALVVNLAKILTLFLFDLGL
jgi:hypothetical protein